MKKLLVLILLCHVASSEKHSLKYFVYGNSGVPNLPQFAGALMVNGVLMGDRDSNSMTLKAKLDWVEKLLEENPDYLGWYERRWYRLKHFFMASIDDLKLRLNQTEGVHTLQRVNGCEWDDETGEVDGFHQYGYDGEDFIVLDLQTRTWVAPNPKALPIKLRWDVDEARQEDNKNMYLHLCPEMLKKYVKYGRTFLQRTERPSVSLLQRTPSSPVSCFATGFFPDRAMMFWRKDGEELHQDVEMGELLPNHDETFQMSVDLNAPSEEDWGSYDCVFHLSGVTDDIITKLDKAAIRTNWVSPSEFPAAAVIGGVIGGLVLLGAAGIFIWRRKKTGFHLVPRAAPGSLPATVTDESISST